MTVQLELNEYGKVCASTVFGLAHNWYERFMHAAQQTGVDIEWACRHTNELEGHDWLCLSVHFNGSTDRAIYFISLLMGDVCNRMVSDTLRDMYLVDKDYVVDDFTVPFEVNPIIKRGWALVLPNVRTHLLEHAAHTLPNNARYIEHLDLGLEI